MYEYVAVIERHVLGCTMAVIDRNHSLFSSFRDSTYGEGGIEGDEEFGPDSNGKNTSYITD